MRTPNQHEIEQAAVELGYIKPGERVPPRLYSKVAKAVQLTADLPPEDDTDDAPAEDFVDDIVTTHTALIEGGLSDTAADRVVAAIAPAIWRETRGAAHAFPR
ncbi:hypothetical protein [Prescottella equi]|uniref:hypothetical protein n=1 Tax=Rhodococcus hoagii TaxID=43767 RepID=UPI0007CD7E60|nr:hypothetical protein [Prescottella equi]ORL01566.1 hypothetical protein A6F56_04400 [Prescottella equi]